jgi:hypothetical protein
MPQAREVRAKHRPSVLLPAPHRWSFLQPDLAGQPGWPGALNRWVRGSRQDSKSTKPDARPGAAPRRKDQLSRIALEAHDDGRANHTGSTCRRRWLCRPGRRGSCRPRRRGVAAWPRRDRPTTPTRGAIHRHVVRLQAPQHRRWSWPAQRLTRRPDEHRVDGLPTPAEPARSRDRRMRASARSSTAGKHASLFVELLSHA